jgi:cell division protein FtsI (penicillin-binding protein 3)
MRQRARGANTRLRLYGVLGVLVLGASSLIVRAVDMQLLNDDFYQQQGDARFLREIEIPTSRGMITDRNGEPLAVSTPVESIWVSPVELLQHTDRLPQLAAALDTDIDALTQRLAERADKEFMFLRRHMNPDDADAITALGIPGVFSQREFRRYYPLGDVVAHVLGKTNIDDHGQEGLELAFEEWLSGTPGAKRVIRDRRGRIVENVDLIRAPEPGQDLVLTIDRRIQYLAHRELMNALVEHQAATGSIVVLDVANGEILAMVNQPSYNPNLRQSSDPGSHRNRALTDVFEPGSVMKTLTLAAGIESGKFTPDTEIQTAPGYISIAGYPIRDFKNYGTLTVSGVLSKSSNVGATKISATLSNEHQYDIYRRFGLGQASGSGFPGEAAGVFPVRTSWSGRPARQTISYGYGLATTAADRAGVCGDRQRRLPAPAEFVKDASTIPAKQVLDPSSRSRCCTMMQTVTAPGGTATQRRDARLPRGRQDRHLAQGQRAAGIRDRNIRRLFRRPGAGVASRVRDGGGGQRSAVAQGVRWCTAASVAAPVFRNVMEGALRLMDVRRTTWMPGWPRRPPPRPSAPRPPSSPGVPVRAIADAGTTSRTRAGACNDPRRDAAQRTAAGTGRPVGLPRGRPAW